MKRTKIAFVRGAVCALSLVLACVLLLAGCGSQQQYEVADENTEAFGQLLTDLVNAYENPSSGDAEAIKADVEGIRAVDERDGEVAQSIADHWQHVYLDSSYKLALHDGSDKAKGVDAMGIPDDGAHAIVVLGYELKDGKMTPELKGRCDAAAALARSYPQAILVCTGGATGENNPDKHTEAGLMKEYLAGKCGIDEGRIHIDESAMTTAENAENTFKIMRDQGVHTMTIVTSKYHQRWGQAVYNAVGALYKQRFGYDVSIVGDYSYDIEPEVEAFRKDDRFAAFQIAQILDLPQDVVASLPALPKL